MSMMLYFTLLGVVVSLPVTSSKAVARVWYCHVNPPCTSGPKWLVHYSSLISAVINNAGTDINYPHVEVVIRRTSGCHSFFTWEMSLTATWDSREGFGADQIYSCQSLIFAEDDWRCSCQLPAKPLDNLLLWWLPILRLPYNSVVCMCVCVCV